MNRRLSFLAVLLTSLVVTGCSPRQRLMKAVRAAEALLIQADKDLMAMLQRRSESILAHGTTPINDADCTSLLEKTREFFAAELPDLDRLCDNLRFPWLSAD